MKKSEIMELIASYHAHVNTAPLLSNVPYQKGWFKRLLNTQTTGILKLQRFIESTSIQALGPNDEIQGDTLAALLTIMMERENRLLSTSRSYENAPEKSTNRVYQRLFHLLLLDYFMVCETGLDYPYKERLFELIKMRFDNQLLGELEKNADELFESEFSFSPGEKLCQGYRDLGMAYLFGHRINHTFTQQPLHTQKGLSNHVKILSFDENKIEIELIFLNQELYASRFLRGEKQFEINIEKGLQWLEKASFWCDPLASMALAEFYARRGNFAKINGKINADKTFKYLEKAKNSGSEWATIVLEDWPRFGQVRINDYEYENEEVKALVRPFR